MADAYLALELISRRSVTASLLNVTSHVKLATKTASTSPALIWLPNFEQKIKNK